MNEVLVSDPRHIYRDKQGNIGHFDLTLYDLVAQRNYPSCDAQTMAVNGNLRLYNASNSFWITEDSHWSLHRFGANAAKQLWTRCIFEGFYPVIESEIEVERKRLDGWWLKSLPNAYLKHLDGLHQIAVAADRPMLYTEQRFPSAVIDVGLWQIVVDMGGDNSPFIRLEHCNESGFDTVERDIIWKQYYKEQDFLRAIHERLPERCMLVGTAAMFSTSFYKPDEWSKVVRYVAALCDAVQSLTAEYPWEE